MRLFDKRYLYFVLLFFAVLILDDIFFIGLFTQIFSHPPNGFIIGASLMFGFFIIIPAAVSYYLIFKLKRKSLEHLQIKNVNNTVVAVIIVVLTVILVILFKIMTPNKFEPYTFYQVTDKEFSKPLKIVATKKIGEDEYYLKETGEGGVSLYQKIGTNRADDKFLFDAPLEAEKVKEFWYDSSTNTVLAIAYSNVGARDTLEQIFKFTLNVQVQHQNRIEVLKTFLLGIYQGRDEILDYFPESKTALLESTGGDGYCGGGSIWTLTEKDLQTLQIFNIGCDLKEGPTFIGYDGKFLYFAVFDQSNTASKPEEVLKEIFKINPRSKSRINLTSKGLPENVASVRLSDKTIIMTTDEGKNFTLDLEGSPQ